MHAYKLQFFLVGSLGCSIAQFGMCQGRSDAYVLDNFPSPGTRGNTENVPYIGKSDPNKNPVRLAKSTGHVSNYDESKVAAYTLPDPLTLNDGTKVVNAMLWQNRRQELLKFYRDEFYGNVPVKAPRVEWQAEKADDSRESKYTTRRVLGKIDRSGDSPKIQLVIHQPVQVTMPTPAVVHLNFTFPSSNPNNTTTSAPRANLVDVKSEFIARGWTYISIKYTDIQPDQPNTQNQGVIGLTLNSESDHPAPDEWGSISAWAWALSRVIDYLETVPDIDSKKICMTGTSRLGKTVLWAAAQDERVAAVFSCVPGEMGASLIRRDWGETLDDMVQNFPWQFCGNLKKWAGRWNELPVDQHMLISLIAPRPVYVNGGLTDQWSDPKGEFLAMVAAGPVYKLLGAKDLETDQLPELDHPVMTGDLAFHYHSGGHGASPKDWALFIDFAERHFQNEKK